MAEALALIAPLLIAAGVLFFMAGALGLWRFPDVYTRLHALTKADNLGLGLLCMGLAFQASSVPLALKLLLVWGLVLVASSIGATLVASTALARGLRPQMRRESRDQ